MTQQKFIETPVSSKTIVIYAGKQYLLLGLNWLSGTIRLKGHTENLNADYSECEYLEKKS